MYYSFNMEYFRNVIPDFLKEEAVKEILLYKIMLAFSSIH